MEKYFERKILSKLYIIEALLLLAFNTGCVEDEIISEKILKELYSLQIICDEDIEIFNKFILWEILFRSQNFLVYILSIFLPKEKIIYNSTFFSMYF